MTSSLRNSLHRRNHKERSQLAHRAKLGILEKHADYVKRARDYHSKQDRLTRLKQKAAERNKDEFYFSMKKQATKGGVHIHDRGNVALPTDIVKVLKTQDENYIRTIRLAGLKKIDKIKNQLMVLANLVKGDDKSLEGLDEPEIELLQDAGVIPGSASTKRGKTAKLQAKRVIFVDNEEEARQYDDKTTHIVDKTDTTDAMEVDPTTSQLGWKAPKSSRKGKEKAALPSPTKTSTSDLDLSSENDTPQTPTPSSRPHLLKELSARLARDKQLRYAQRELEMQRLLMGKGRRSKIRGVELVEGGDDDGDRDSDDEDALDARKGKKSRTVRRVVDEKLYKPRVYKWKQERK